MSTSATSERRTQAERRTEAERRLIEAASLLISENGTSHLTLAKVGERAGYSRGLVAYHFGSKAALVRAVAETVTTEFRDAMASARSNDGSLLDEVLVLVGVYFDIIVDPPALNRARLALIAESIAHRHTAGRDAIVEADQHFRTLIANRVTLARTNELMLPAIDPAGFATTLVGMLRGIAFASMLDPSTDLTSARREVEAFVRARLGATESPRPF